MLVVALGRVGRGVALDRGDQNLARLLLGDFGHPLFVLVDARADFVRQFLVEHFQQPMRRFFFAQAADS